jgi:peroxiredoxin Q/BCP
MPRVVSASSVALVHLTNFDTCQGGIMAELKEGDKAPDIKIATDTGETFQLSSLKGKTVVLYFYPKADTPGCTKESCSFRDTVAEFRKRNTEVIGISPDKVDKQAKFKAKYDLTFPLLADADHEVAEAYGVWKQKSMMGRKYMGVERTTFIIDGKGKISKIFRKVKVDGHTEEVLAALG